MDVSDTAGAKPTELELVSMINGTTDKEKLTNIELRREDVGIIVLWFDKEFIKGVYIGFKKLFGRRWDAAEARRSWWPEIWENTR